MFEKLKAIPKYMDYDGQRKAEKIFQAVIVTFAIVGFVWGYAIQRFSVTVLVLSVGFLVCCILVLPPWPYYRQHPLKWQKPVQDESTEGTPGGSKKQKRK